jgi:NAD(P)H-nitrite reductase large subunit
MKYLILGNGVAAIHAAEAIRSLDSQGSITMISDEGCVPYCRPMISMVLEGSITPDALPIRGPGFYRNLGIEAVLGERVTSLDVVGSQVMLGDGRVFGYDRLLIATGADPQPVKAENADLDSIFFMRTELDVRRMLEALPGARSALVLGGGLVGFKAAYGLLRRGLKVTLLIRSEYPLSLQVDETAGRLIRDELVRCGLKVRVGLGVRAFEGNGVVRAAHLSDGSTVECDLVVIGKGVLPAVDFVPRDRLPVDLGILVDEHMQTYIPGVFAAGDVAEHMDVSRKTRWVNAIWPEAVQQGRIAGMNMAGRRVVHRGSLSRNVIRIFGMDVMTAGWVNPPPDEGFDVLHHTDCRTGAYRRLVFRGDRLVGMTLVNDIEQGGVLMALIQQETPVPKPREILLGRSFQVGQLMA